VASLRSDLTLLRSAVMEFAWKKSKSGQWNKWDKSGNCLRISCFVDRRTRDPYNSPGPEVTLFVVNSYDCALVNDEIYRARISLTIYNRRKMHMCVCGTNLNFIRITWAVCFSKVVISQLLITHIWELSIHQIATIARSSCAAVGAEVGVIPFHEDLGWESEL
jgi:hypothetical protein